VILQITPCQPSLSVNHGQGAGWIAVKPFRGMDSQRLRFNPNSWFMDPPTDCPRRYTRLGSQATSHEFDRKLVTSSSGSRSRESPVHISAQLQHASLPRLYSAAKLLGPAAAVVTRRESASERWPAINFGRYEKKRLYRCQLRQLVAAHSVAAQHVH
jgi:hypothetical protein